MATDFRSGRDFPRRARERQILAWLQARVPAERRDATNAYLAQTWTHKMDKHDRDEGCPSTSLGMTTTSLGMTTTSLGMTTTSLGMTTRA